MKRLIRSIPIIGPLAQRAYRRLLGPKGPFTGSEDYWVSRYESEGNSGAGSYGKLAEFKAEVLNQFVREHKIETVIEYGCGDGNQLRLAQYPSYLGFDVSDKAIGLCREAFGDNPARQFRSVASYNGERADLTMSLDVIYHLIEDQVFDTYMRTLFESSDRFVVIYSSNTDEAETVPHVRHRRFSDWIEAHAPGWRLLRHIPNRYPYKGDSRTGSFADFFFYEKS